MQSRILQAILAVALIVALSGCSSFCRKEEEPQKPDKKISLSDVPEPARAKIEKLMAGGEMKVIEKDEDKGLVIYDVDRTI